MSNDFLNYLGGGGLNLLVALIIVRFIYYSAAQGKGYILLFLMFNTVIYFVMIMLNSIALSLGVGFGLFAIFSVLRYRTEDIPIREITYLFVMIALALINSALPSSQDFAKIGLANVAIVVVLWVLEREWGFHFEVSKLLTYEVIDFIKPQNRALLLDDLQKRTGLPVKRVEINRIDFLRDTAELRIYYDEPRDIRAASFEVRSEEVAVEQMLAGSNGWAVEQMLAGIDEVAVQQMPVGIDQVALQQMPVSSNEVAIEQTPVRTDEVAIEHTAVRNDEVAIEHAPVRNDEVAVKQMPVSSDEVAVEQTPLDSDEVAVEQMPRTTSIITLAAVLGVIGGFVVGLTGLLTGGH